VYREDQFLGEVFAGARMLLKLVICAGVAACLFATPARSGEKHWQVVMAGDRKVGFVEHTRREDGAKILTSEALTLELGKSGRRVTYRVRIDTESSRDGSLLRLVRDSETREGHAHVDARVIGPDLVVSIGAGRNQQTRSFAGLGADLKTLEFARAWLKATGSGAQPAPLSFRTFDPVKLVPVDLELTRLDAPDGRPRLQRRLRTSAGLEATTLQAVNAQGEVVEASLRLGGVRLTLLGATEAAARSANQVLDHVVAQFQKSPYRITGHGARAKIRYGFDNGGRAPNIPVGGGQRSWTDGATTWIQVCAECAPDAAELPAERRALALAATPWLNFADTSFMARARRTAAGSGNPRVIMRRLTDYVRSHMSVEQIDMLGYGSAFEAFRTRRGDCTEYAVLLAAMGRAAGVPTRVVSGLVYSRNFEGQRHVFVPHAWVHAWTGSAWESFDAALGYFDSTHLAFAVSLDGNPAELFAGLNLSHELKLVSAARVLPRKPAN
jgi:hypothetical protein